MEKTKTIVLLIAACVLIAAVAAIAVTQFANAQPSNATSQAPQGTAGNAQFQQGNYPNGGQTQNGYSYGYGRMGMGMCGRY